MPYIGKSPSAGVRQRYQYTATAGQTTFSGTDLGNLTLTYTDNNFVDVFQNGVLLKGGGTDYTATSGTSVVLATGASVSDVIEIIVYDVFSVGNFFNRTDSDSRYLNVAGDTMTGSLDLNGTELVLDVDGDSSITSDTDDQIDFKTGGTDRAVIDSSGRVLLGTSTAQGNMSLQIQGDGSASTSQGSIFLRRGLSTSSIGGNTGADLGLIQFGDSDGGIYAKIEAKSDDSAASNDYPGRLQFSTTADAASSPTERMRIGHGYNNNGAVFFGTYVGTGDYDDPGYNNSGGIVFRDLNGTGPEIMVNTTGKHFFYKVGTGTMIEFVYKSSASAGGSVIGTISTDGSATAYNTSSDYRLKENVSTDWDATTRLKQLKPSRFNWKANKDKTVDGFLAHEVSSIVPEAINGEKDAVDEKGNPQYQGIDQSKLVPLLTKALQESIARADALEARIKKLEDD